MSHKSVRLLIESTAKSLADDIQFTYARTSDFNMMRDKKYPFVVCDPLLANPQFAVNGVTNYSKPWTASMAFYQLDKEGSTQDEYKLILDEMDFLIDKFIHKLNFFSYDSDSVTLTFGQQVPFVKATADILTGYLIPIIITPSDNFDSCVDGLNCVTTSDECRDN